jgi:hypothetical protein
MRANDYTCTVSLHVVGAAGFIPASACGARARLATSNALLERGSSQSTDTLAFQF